MLWFWKIDVNILCTISMGRFCFREVRTGFRKILAFWRCPQGIDFPVVEALVHCVLNTKGWAEAMEKELLRGVNPLEAWSWAKLTSAFSLRFLSCKSPLDRVWHSSRNLLLKGGFWLHLENKRTVGKNEIQENKWNLYFPVVKVQMPDFMSLAIPTILVTNSSAWVRDQRK